ncbi:MAG: asparagine synthase (glutamine-hydrolyzing) [Candidatus Altarchaeum sp. CG12_big_fil_rev_8_21_14_0_65_33_22]|nr:MAG: asparagine synthase (glutamine-hydrolyzing) [Candidatus Altarchaeum sp. CG2_30_32_3053]PIN68174.1 MAG: asparagine synthase (glutamine-hydrolyzing) [Candidatus Altarchaeum sp. CG12_big_fil_rev_8_21_14_0_65_33_22]PIZ32967.1 MAG: asparagine synthase (glutamine-hydrolyzing) [Candidatus Altarchaeum sp. CG_4_10_14_0_8_um_filter_32_851]
MCGINGFNWKDEELCRVMADALKHRGPDDEGFYFDSDVSLGHRRLSIIDLKSGHQPIHNEDISIWIIFNGEIYNHKNIRTELESKHKFYTNSDTEMIIHAYEEYGFDCVKKFNGMWAFCIYDKNKNLMFLSRDRFGIKPLYYFFDSKNFIFASEIKGLLTHVKPEENDGIIYDFLVNNKDQHKEDTFFKCIKSVMPSTNLIFDLKTKEIKKEKYWDIKSINRKTESSLEEDEEYAKIFSELFKNTVKMRLMSEVPIGTCISGGLDSSSIVCILNKLLLEGNEKIKENIGEKQKTFSAVYEYKKVDEREYIEEVIKNTNLEKHYVFPSGKELFKEMEKLVYYQEEPFFSTSIYAQWNVMRLASKKVKVLLDGQGSDELLAGYLNPELYPRTSIEEILKQRKFLTFFKERLMKPKVLFKDINAILDAFALYFMKQNVFTIEELLNQIFLGEFENKKRTSKEANDSKEIKDIADWSYDLLMNGGIQTLLKYEDRNSMAFSIEARVPFLDYMLVEYIFSIPISQRIKNGWTKYILRNAMKDILPEKVRKRRSKLGFPTPQETWFKKNKDKILEIFNSESLKERKYFNQKAIIKSFNEFCNGKKYDSNMFWKIINLEIWFRVFIVY